MEKPSSMVDATLPVDDLGFAGTVEAPPMSTRLGMGPIDPTKALQPLSATRTAPVCVLLRVQGHVDELRLVLEDRIRYTPIRVLGPAHVDQTRGARSPTPRGRSAHKDSNRSRLIQSTVALGFVAGAARAAPTA
jgi:hypothetical protein